MLEPSWPAKNVLRDSTVSMPDCTRSGRRCKALGDRAEGFVVGGTMNDQLIDNYSSSPDPHGHSWMGFTLDTSADLAATMFERRYGQHPEYMFKSRGLLLAGPIPTGMEVLR